MQLGVKTIGKVATCFTQKHQAPADKTLYGNAEDYKNTQQFKNMQWLITNYRSLMRLYGREKLPEEQLDTRSFHKIIEELMLDNAKPWKFDEFVNELRSVAATTTEILGFVRHSLNCYRFYCQLSGDEKLHQQCRILWKYYIAPSNESQKSLRRQIVYKENIKQSYFYIFLNDGIKKASKFLLN